MSTTACVRIPELAGIPEIIPAPSAPPAAPQPVRPPRRIHRLPDPAAVRARSVVAAPWTLRSPVPARCACPCAASAGVRASWAPPSGFPPR